MRSMVEGRARSALFLNQSDYAVETVPNIRGQKAQRLYAASSKEEVTPLIARRIVAHVMAPSVNLDRQRSGVAEEIQRIGLAWVLTSKFESAGPRSQHRPEPALRRRHVAAELARSLETGH